MGTVHDSRPHPVSAWPVRADSGAPCKRFPFCGRFGGRLGRCPQRPPRALPSAEAAPPAAPPPAPHPAPPAATVPRSAHGASRRPGSRPAAARRRRGPRHRPTAGWITRIGYWHGPCRTLASDSDTGTVQSRTRTAPVSESSGTAPVSESVTACDRDTRRSRPVRPEARPDSGRSRAVRVDRGHRGVGGVSVRGGKEYGEEKREHKIG